jgi:DNA repair exonuclease SbcCD ATPase subunit
LRRGSSPPPFCHSLTPSLPPSRNASDLSSSKQALALENERLAQKIQSLEQDLDSLRSNSSTTTPSTSCNGHLETIDRLEAEIRGYKSKMNTLEVCPPLFVPPPSLTGTPCRLQGALTDSQQTEQSLRNKFQAVTQELSELQSQHQSLQTDFRTKKRDLEDAFGLLLLPLPPS